MQQRRLGSSQVSVSEIGLGTWGMSGAFWGAADDAELIRVIHQALDLGVTLVDTAEAYGWGHSEEVVGKALAGRRQKAVIATKVAGTTSSRRNRDGAGRSLKRLQTDSVEVYFIHWPNPDFPIGPTMEALERLRASRKESRPSASPTSAPRRWTRRANTARSTCCSPRTTCCGAKWRPKPCPIAASTNRRDAL